MAKIQDNLKNDPGEFSHGNKSFTRRRSGNQEIYDIDSPDQPALPVQPPVDAGPHNHPNTTWSTGWVNTDGTTTVANAATLNFTHNLGTTDAIFQAMVADNAFGDNAQILGEYHEDEGSYSTGFGHELNNITNSSITLQLGVSGYYRFDSAGINAVNAGGGSPRAFTNKWVKVVGSLGGGVSVSGSSSGSGSSSPISMEATMTAPASHMTGGGGWFCFDAVRGSVIHDSNTALYKGDSTKTLAKDRAAVYTIPETGVYQINCLAQQNSSQTPSNTTLNLYLNGLAQEQRHTLDVNGVLNGENMEMSRFSIAKHLNAGDELAFEYTNSSANSPLLYGHLSIAKYGGGTDSSGGSSGGGITFLEELGTLKSGWNEVEDQYKNHSAVLLHFRGSDNWSASSASAGTKCNDDNTWSTVRLIYNLPSASNINNRPRTPTSNTIFAPIVTDLDGKRGFYVTWSRMANQGIIGYMGGTGGSGAPVDTGDTVTREEFEALKVQLSNLGGATPTIRWVVNAGKIRDVVDDVDVPWFQYSLDKLDARTWAYNSNYLLHIWHWIISEGWMNNYKDRNVRGFQSSSVSTMKSSADHVASWNGNWSGGSSTTPPYNEGKFGDYWNNLPSSALHTPAADGTETKNQRYKDFCTSWVVEQNYGSKGDRSPGFSSLSESGGGTFETEWMKSWCNWLNNARIGEHGHLY